MSVCWGSNDDDDGLGFVAFILLMVFLAACNLALFFLSLAISRQREFLADVHGAQTTRYPKGLANALRKIGQSGSAVSTATQETSPFFFANPLKSFSKLSSTHPPIEDRITRLEGLEDKGY